MPSKYISKHLWLCLLAYLSMAFSLTSCFTGVEGTNKISLSRQDKKILAPDPEDIFLSDVKPVPLSEWEPGKKFIAADNRTALAFIQEGLPVDPDRLALEGKTLSYIGNDAWNAPDGSVILIVVFRQDGNIFRFDTGKSPEKALDEVMSSEIPMLIDYSMISSADSIMKGQTFWTRSSLWYDADDNRMQGGKYVPVTIDSVTPGNLVFPAKVYFTAADGEKASMYMNLANTSSDSRAFPNLFALTDPRLRYSGISDEVWTLIQNGRVRPGMTKEECRLALGTPSDVASGHDWSQTLDIWRYDNGNYVYLRFEDGLLIDIRR